MSFIYRAPLSFPVSANIAGQQLRFNEEAALLVKYVDEDPVHSRAEDDAERGPRPLEVAAVLRSDGKTSIDAQWWSVIDIGPSKSLHTKEGVRVAKVVFDGVGFAKRIAGGCSTAQDWALHDAFLEQDSIQVVVKLRDARTDVPPEKRFCWAPIVLRVWVDSQARAPAAPRPSKPMTQG